MNKANIILIFEEGTLICRKHCEKIISFESDDSIYESKNMGKYNENNDHFKETALNKMRNEEIVDFGDESKESLNILRRNVIRNIEKLHSNVNMNLPLRTDIRAEIRTIAETPIWSKQYTYALSANNFINNEIERLLEDEIIRPSKSRNMGCSEKGNK